MSEQVQSPRNPIEAAMAYLQDCGYTKQEAENLLRAPKADSPEALIAMIDDWIEHVGEHKRYQTTLLDLVATGCIDVERGEDGEWLFALRTRSVADMSEHDESTDPIMAYLKECGYTGQEAENLRREIEAGDGFAVLLKTGRDYLQDCGYTKQEAENLLCAPKADTQSALMVMLDEWIGHVGEHKRYQRILDLVAAGAVDVKRGENGEWLFKLLDLIAAGAVDVKRGENGEWLFNLRDGFHVVGIQ